MITTRKFPISRNKPPNYAKMMPIQMMQKYKLPLLLIFLHIPLGVVLYSSRALALLYPSAIFFLGLYYAIRKHEKLEKVAVVASYLVGAEVLWRMARSPIFWEFGKYGVVAIMVVALIQRGYLKFPNLPFMYFAFLIPACFLTLINNDASVARSSLSFNMSGPLSLFVSCWFFSNLKVTEAQLKKILFTIAIPIVSVAVTTLFVTVTTENIHFSTESNVMTSGGFGPNQVSSMLGLGVFVCLTYYLLFKNSFKDTIYISVLCILFAAQSVMTFSRGGMYNAVGATLVIIILQMRNLNQGIKRMIPILGIGLIFLLLVFPYLNDFTGGKLQERFDETGTTNRADIVESDFQLFLEHPVLGTGVGESKTSRMEYFTKEAASHTEFSRLISEHGMFGIFSIIALTLGAVYSFKRQRSNMGKAFVVGMIVWSFLFMLNAGMRLAGPGFMWGLSFITLLMPQMRKKKVINPATKQKAL